MTKHRSQELMKSFKAHVDPEKEEELKWIQIENENKVKKILKVVKSINQGNKEANLKKKLELNQLIEDFSKQYQSLYALYDNLKGEVKKRVLSSKNGDSSSSSSSGSDSEEPFYSPDTVSARNSPMKRGLHKLKEEISRKLENSDPEEAYLKDKLTSTSEVVKEALNVENESPLSNVEERGKRLNDLEIEAVDSQNEEEKLVDESSLLKEKLVEKDAKILALSKAHEMHKRETTAQIRELEGQVYILKLELETLGSEKTEVEELLGRKESEAKELREKKLELEKQISELEKSSKDKEEEISALMKTFEEKQKHSVSKIDELVARANNLQSEVDSLRAQKGALEEKLENETNARILGLMDQIDVLKHELESISSKKTDSGINLEKTSQEMSEGNAVDEKENFEKEKFEMKVKDLEQEVQLLANQKRDLEEKMKSMERKANQSRVEKEILRTRLLELEKRLEDREREKNEIISLTAQINSLKKDVGSLQTERNGLRLQLERGQRESSKNLIRLENQNDELTRKVEDHQRTLIEREEIMNKLTEEHKKCEGKFMDFKTNIQLAEKKFEEVAEDFRKQFEDNLRILSRRIRVAEQLHVENKDWYQKTKEKYEQESKEVKFSLGKIKDITLSAHDMLMELDTMGLKFEECNAHFMNRISKVSCELIFAKDWVKRKNKAIAHVKDDLDIVLAQLDDKEAEILGFREKVWKLENKVRELEKMVKQKEEGMLSLGEEKREAIRQLCVWIDYHRSHSDHLKKLLTGINERTQSTL